MRHETLDSRAFYACPAKEGPWWLTVLHRTLRHRGIKRGTSRRWLWRDSNLGRDEWQSTSLPITPCPHQSCSCTSEDTKPHRESFSPAEDTGFPQYMEHGQIPGESVPSFFPHTALWADAAMWLSFSTSPMGPSLTLQEGHNSPLHKDISKAQTKGLGSIF